MPGESRNTSSPEQDRPDLVGLSIVRLPRLRSCRHTAASRAGFGASPEGCELAELGFVARLPRSCRPEPCPHGATDGPMQPSRRQRSTCQRKPSTRPSVQMSKTGAEVVPQFHHPPFMEMQYPLWRHGCPRPADSSHHSTSIKAPVGCECSTSMASTTASDNPVICAFAPTTTIIGGPLFPSTRRLRSILVLSRSAGLCSIKSCYATTRLP